MYDAIEFRGNDQSDVEELAANAGVPVYNGLTNEWHPTQMLADFLTMHEASGKPYGALCLRLRRRLPVQHGSLAAGHGRVDGGRRPAGGPPSLAPPADVVAIARDIATRTGAQVTVTDDLDAGVADVDFVPHRRLGVDGRVQGRLDRAGATARAVPGELGPAGEDEQPRVKFMHCLPAFHDPNTVVGREMMEHTGMSTGLEVTGEVFESEASIVFDQAENRLHTIKAILVATLGT